MLNYKYYILTILLSVVANSQSMKDLQKLNVEYEKYKNQQNQFNNESSLDIDPITGLPREAIIYPYSPFEPSRKDTILKKSNFFGYDFFTRRDTISFWENLPAPANYLLGPGDELVISLWGETQLRESYTIDRDGKIYDDKVGLLNISGKNLSDARNYLKAQYGRLYATLDKKPQSTFIDVSLGNLQSINVNFVGQVKYPGVYAVHPFSTIITGLIQAGGIDTTGSLRNIQLKRNGQVKQKIDLYNYLIKGDLAANIQLRDQDIIVVPPRKSVINIDSAIVNKGIYEAIPGETVYDLIQYAGGLTYDASDMVGIRSINTKDRKSSGNYYFAYYENYEKTKDILINNGDHITILRLLDELQEVELIGQVKAPGKYHYNKDMKFLDLIKLGGGFEDSTFWKSVYQYKAEIIRRSPETAYDKVITLDLSKLNEEYNNVSLQNLDRVVIHANSNFFQKENVQILGEVKVPGSYPLISDNETLKSIIDRAGDLTSKAMKKGISIYRDKKYFEMQKSSKEEFSGQTNSTIVQPNKDFQSKLEQNKVRVAWQNLSVILMPGDSIVVKESPGAVNISGEIYNPGLIEYNKGKGIRYYLNASGGITNEGSKKNIIVIYANGVVSPKKWYSSPKIEDGATIVVNRKPPSDPFNPTEFANTILSLISSLVTILILSKQI